MTSEYKYYKTTLFTSITVFTHTHMHTHPHTHTHTLHQNITAASHAAVAEDEFHGSLQVPLGGSEGTAGQALVRDAHVSQLLQLSLDIGHGG